MAKSTPKVVLNLRGMFERELGRDKLSAYENAESPELTQLIGNLGESGAVAVIKYIAQFQSEEHTITERSQLYTLALRFFTAYLHDRRLENLAKAIVVMISDQGRRNIVEFLQMTYPKAVVSERTSANPANGTTKRIRVSSARVH